MARVLDVGPNNQSSPDTRETSIKDWMSRLVDNIPGTAVFRFVDTIERGVVFEYMSDGFEALTGYPARAVLEDSGVLFYGVHTDDVERLIEGNKRATLTGTHFDEPFRFWHKDGSLRHLRSRSRPVVREDNEIVWDGALIDETAIHEALEAKRRAEKALANLAMVARETSDSVVLSDTEFKIQWVNEAATRMSGFSEEEMLGANLLQLARAEEIAPAEAREMIARLARGETFRAEVWTNRKNGERVRIEFEAKPFRDENGLIVGYMGITRDMTARALAEEELREREEHLREAQQLARVGSWKFGVSTQTIQWSEELYRIFGRDTESGAPTFPEFIASIAEQDRAALLKCVDRAIEKGVGYELFHKVKRPDGTVRDVLARGNARKNAEGRVVELYGTSQDITERLVAERERLELQERLLAAQRFESLGLLAGGIAHDFNNLLMGVLMEASVIAKSPEAPMADSLKSIQDAAKRMSELTGQLLAYAGRGQFVLETINPNAVVTDMLELLRRNINPDASLEVEISSEPATLEIDGSQLRQVIMNLVINASDALDGQPGRIAVRTRITQKESGTKSWALEVSDSGSGISKNVRQRIFDPFFTTKKTGRGLGLSTVHGIVQRCKGSVDVHSEPGSGTTFLVDFPLVKGPVVEDERPPVLGVKKTGLRVLIADDEATVRRSMRRMLEMQNAKVVEVADGVAAMDALNHSTEAFDLVLLDVVMPRKNGYEVLAEARQRHPGLKVILMSGYNNPAAIAGAKSGEGKPDAALQKPFDWSELERAIQSVLDPRQTNSH